MKRLSLSRRARLLGGLLIACTIAGCAHAPRPGTPLRRRGDEIMVCGQLFHTNTPVVLWTDPGGYDAYRVHPHFEPPPAAGEDPPAVVTYGSERRNLPPDLQERVRRDGWSLDDLKEVVRLFVLHYDAAGTSRQCFKTLHDVRRLSVHFMLDIDGTIYQTLDLKERAWHATVANDASIGIEIANVGAYDNPDHATLRNWYRSDTQGPRISIPDRLGDGGLRHPGYVARPARPELISGEIHGVTYYQYDFTDAQYVALTKLTAALHKIFPRLRPQVPRQPSGAIRTDVLEEAELETFEGIIGHWHVTERKRDPGPAFQWGRLLRGPQ